MTGEERMNRREEVREVGEEVKLRMMVRRRDAGFYVRMKLEAARQDPGSCQAFHSGPPEFPFRPRLWLLRNDPGRQNCGLDGGVVAHWGAPQSWRGSLSPQRGLFSDSSR